MTTDTPAPAWTRDPVRAARERTGALWPAEAEQFDARTKLRGANRNDPRPHAGYVTERSYCEFPACDHAGHRRFECVRCGLGKVLSQSPTDLKYDQIRFGCPACRQSTYHNPAGIPGRYLRLYE